MDYSRALIVTIVVGSEQVGHHFGVGVAGVIQAGKSEARFKRLQQRKVGIEAPALNPVLSVIGLHGQQYLVGSWQNAVIVFVPDNDNGVVPLLPGWRTVDDIEQRAQREIALINQGGIQADLRAVIIGVKIAHGSGVAAAVLVVALVGNDEGKIREVTGIQVRKEALRSLATDHILQAVAGIQTFLNALEISERIVLYGVAINERLLFTGNHGGDVRSVGKEAVAVIDAVRA